MGNPEQMKDNLFNSVLDPLENWCTTFNNFSNTLFFCLKYSLIFVLIAIGILTIKKYRGIYREQRVKEQDWNEEEKIFREKLKEPSVILGIFYIALAIGFLLGTGTKILMILLDPIPDGFLFDFINFGGWIPADIMNRIKSLEKATYPHEKTIYYAISYFSFMGFVSMIMGLRFIVLYANKTHETSFKMFVWGLIDCILSGFTTFMPLFL